MEQNGWILNKANHSICLSIFWLAICSSVAFLVISLMYPWTLLIHLRELAARCLRVALAAASLFCPICCCLAWRLSWLTLRAVSLVILALGLTRSRALVLVRGLAFWVLWRTRSVWAALTADWISLELMILEMSGLVTSWVGRLHPFFWELLWVQVPKMLLSSLKALSVQMTNLPTCPPGASWRRLSLLTWATSTPGMFLSALIRGTFAPLQTTRGPLLLLYLLFRSLPFPALTFTESMTFCTSLQAPTSLKNLAASLVRSIFSAASETTSGNSGTELTLCPLAWTRGRTALAASAVATAYLFCLRLFLLCHLLQILMGANILPFRHMFPKAPCPFLEVPEPPTRGIRETARPVPHDSAECFMPAKKLTAWPCLLFLEMLVWTKLTISGLMPTLKTAGRTTLVPVRSTTAFPVATLGLQTWTTCLWIMVINN